MDFDHVDGKNFYEEGMSSKSGMILNKEENKIIFLIF